MASGALSHDDGGSKISIARLSLQNRVATILDELPEDANQSYLALLADPEFQQTIYYNTSDAGDSFLLRDGVPLVDQSTLFVAQAQHGHLGRPTDGGREIGRIRSLGLKAFVPQWIEDAGEIASGQPRNMQDNDRESVAKGWIYDAMVGDLWVAETADRVDLTLAHTVNQYLLHEEGNCSDAGRNDD